MIYCKRYIIATCFSLMLPLTGWCEAPVVDDSDNFALMDEQQGAQAPVASKYDEPQFGSTESGRARNNEYASNDIQDEGPALVKEDSTVESNNPVQKKFSDNANLIEKIQSLQQEVQELRGQLEVQAHDLKLLQQQQVAFYKDLDSRLSSGSSKSAQTKPATDINMDLSSQASVPVSVPSVKPKTAAPKIAKSVPAPKPVPAVSRANPADEQIGYMAAYELVKDKHYDEAIDAMQTFTQKYPTGGYTANAEYWLGELYMVKKDYSKAIEHFDSVLNQFPSSSKSAASMLKSGYAFYLTGNNQEAVKRLEQVVKTYPDTPTAQLAKTKLEAIKSV